MPWILVRHKVHDFAKWKPIFDEHAMQREPAGCKGGYVLRSIDDPIEVIILLEWDELQRARDFVASHDLREAMERAGVVDKPDVFFLELADEPTA
ncbi:MAG: cyclase [Armatimonadota bacterium]|nr:cyclase [Armatimonadota bacterium]